MENNKGAGPILTVGLVTGSFLPVVGGVEAGLHNIALRLIEAGHQARLFVPFQSWKGLHDGNWRLPYPVTPMPPKLAYLLRRAPRFCFFLSDLYFRWATRRYGIDVWHATIGYPTGVLASHFRARTDVPVLVRCVGEDIQREPAIGYGARLDPKIDRLVRRWLPEASAAVAITQTVVDEYEALPISPDKIVRIPNGVDVMRFALPVDRAAVRRSIGLSDTDVVILSVGRYHAKKNFEGLLEAFQRLLLRGHDNAKLVIAGHGLDRLAPLIDSLGLKGSVKLIGGMNAPSITSSLALPPDDLVQLYKSADIFAFFSHVETFGIVLVEAMAAGLPIVTTDAPGCRDVVRPGIDGLSVRRNDADAMTSSLEALVAHPGLRYELGRRSLLRAKEFSWDQVVSSYIALYRKLVKNG